MLGDIQVKMRLSVTGSRDEIRQDYMPLLSNRVVAPFTEKKADVSVSLGGIVSYWCMPDVIA